MNTEGKLRQKECGQPDQMFSVYGLASSEVRQRSFVNCGLCTLRDDSCVTISEWPKILAFMNPLLVLLTT